MLFDCDRNDTNGTSYIETTTTDINFANNTVSVQYIIPVTAIAAVVTG